MEEKTNGWVVVTCSHGHTGRAFMNSSTFARTRKESIDLFVQDSGEPWEYWYRKFNFRCVKAQSLIITT